MVYDPNVQAFSTAYLAWQKRGCAFRCFTIEPASYRAIPGEGRLYVTRPDSSDVRLSSAQLALYLVNKLERSTERSLGKGRLDDKVLDLQARRASDGGMMELWIDCPLMP